ncbi:hypothetical protein [Glaciimonas soli]|uniref:Uncharacterized protein n=1 Tax=Glaciimonas soli TaxID=2590999 RepID=A0A843YW69_9BURK|nr:hypothetical protein [Glaciimonas soli]MQR01933.1 hypothetical protein [Glaciimonas soli]
MLVILLMLVFLPLQVFAGGVESHLKTAEFPALQLLQLNPDYQDSLGSSEDSAKIDLVDLLTDAHAAEAADHADEAIPALVFHFTPHTTSIAPARNNDLAREPPFLPLLAPPPRA